MELGTRHTDLTVEELSGGGMGVKEWSKGWTKRMAATKTLYWARGGDASKADRAWAKQLTADHACAPCC